MTDLLRRRFLLALAGLPLASLPILADARAQTPPPPAKAAKPTPPHPRPAVAAAPGARRKPLPPPAPLLNVRVQQRLGELRAQGLLEPGETTAWAVYDFTWNRPLVAINAWNALQAASMIKPFVATAFFILSGQGDPRLRYGSDWRELMEAMIVHSDNDATNAFIAACGGPARVQATLKRFAPDVFRQTAVVERIPAGGRTYQNRASAMDYVRFLAALWARRFPNSAELLRVMRIPKRNRVYEGAEGVARATEVYDKTGTTARLCGDMGILVARGRSGGEYPYAFVGIVQRPAIARDYEHFMRSRGNAIREVSSLVYQELKDIHGLV